MYQKNDLNLSGILCGAGGPFCGESGPVSVAKGGILLLAEIGILYLTIYTKFRIIKIVQYTLICNTGDGSVCRPAS